MEAQLAKVKKQKQEVQASLKAAKHDLHAVTADR